MLLLQGHLDGCLGLFFFRLQVAPQLLNLLLFLTPVFVFLLAPAEFLQLGFVWILFGFSVLFFLSAKIMRKVLAPLEELAIR